MAKSVPEVAVPPPTLTVTGVALEREPPFSAAVTVIVVALSGSPKRIRLSTDSCTPVEADSSSVTVTVTERAVSDP